jgi:hypothetical protein
MACSRSTTSDKLDLSSTTFRRWIGSEESVAVCFICDIRVMKRYIEQGESQAYFVTSIQLISSRREDVVPSKSAVQTSDSSGYDYRHYILRDANFVHRQVNVLIYRWISE